MERAETRIGEGVDSVEPVANVIERQVPAVPVEEPVRRAVGIRRQVPPGGDGSVGVGTKLGREDRAGPPQDLLRFQPGLYRLRTGRLHVVRIEAVQLGIEERHVRRETLPSRSEERRVGQAWVSTCRYWGRAVH